MISMKLFGSPSRTKALTLVGLLERVPLRARLSGAPLSSVQRMVNDLEREGVIATRIVGANRQVSLNPRFYGANELRALLLKYAKRDPGLERRIASLRRRPRRAEGGRPIDGNRNLEVTIGSNLLRATGLSIARRRFRYHVLERPGSRRQRDARTGLSGNRRYVPPREKCLHRGVSTWTSGNRR